MSAASEAKVSEQPSAQAKIPRVGGDPVVISARRVSLWYGAVIGVNNISLDIGPGVTGLLGPNGAGKSTLLKCLTGQLRPKTGAVTMFGQPIWRNASVFSRVGMVPEQDAFYEEMTARQFVTYLTQLQGYNASDAQRLADDALERLALTSRRDDQIKAFSKGMRQRVKIAQAIAHHPDVLFLDEPLTGTDPIGRRHIIELIQSLGEQGKTVVVSSHVLHEVEQMTQTILMINRGRLIADGNVYSIREMIDAHPHTIVVDCDAPRKLAALLVDAPDVVSVTFNERGFQVATRDPDACYTRIPKLALEHNIALRRMTSPDNNLMAVFRYLVS